MPSRGVRWSSGAVMNPIRILLADDHQLFRECLAHLLAREDGFEIVGQAADGGQAVEMARKLEPDVVVMDVSMPVIDGLEATRRIKAERPGVRVIVLTASEAAQDQSGAIESGAQHFLPKHVDLETLCGALRSDPLLRAIRK